MRTLLALLLAALFVLPGAALAQYPRGVIAEDATATWCVYCPFAYAGLEVMKSRYDANEFTSTRYYSSSSGGGLSTPETDARIAYYNVTGFPTVMFDGIYRVVGGDSEVAAGNAYEPIVSSQIGVPSPLKITINSADLVQPDGSIDFNVEVMQTMPDIGNVKIRVLILENNILWNSETEQDVTRDILPETVLTVSGLGQVQHVVQNFSINPSWKTPDLWAAVFVQDDDTKAILQSASTRPAPDYSMRYWVLGTRAVVVNSNSAPYDFQDFAVYNLGRNPDVIRVTLVPGTMPSGWSCVFTDGINDYSGFVDLNLNPGQGTRFHLKVTPGSAGYATPKLQLTSNNLPGKVREIPYAVITNDVNVLVVDDDGNKTYETYYADALANAGLTYGVWPASLAQVTANDLRQFDAVVWEIGLSYPTLTATDRTELGAYLDGGGRLFIEGQDFGWEMNDQGGGALAWYNAYMHANYISDDANSNNLTGVSGDPISDGMTLALTSSLNPYPDCITARDASATVIFSYNGTSYKGALRVDTGVYRLVYLGFGYEAITTVENRRLLLQRSMQWLGVNPTSTPDAPAQAGGVSVEAWPNPATTATRLSYELPAAGRTVLQIYRPDGGLVRTLVQQVEQAGRHEVLWNGRNGRGEAVPSGVYFYRLATPAGSPSGRLVLTR